MKSPTVFVMAPCIVRRMGPMPALTVQVMNWFDDGGNFEAVLRFGCRRSGMARSGQMLKLGYKLMSEEHGPRELVRNAVRAEKPVLISRRSPTISSDGSKSRDIRHSPGRCSARLPTLRI